MRKAHEHSKANSPEPSQSQSGQATVLIALMISTFFLFFAFVINTGMLVNAKINLQNAADLAAFSGASVQARQLDQIAHLNYEMRRIYKRFLFRYYVLGNLAQDRFPRSGGDATLHKFGPIKINATPQEESANDFKVPSVCIIYNSNSNLCRSPGAPSTIRASYGNQVAVNLFNRTLYEQMKRLEALRTQNCVAWGKMNFNILNNWLFNADPEVLNMSSANPAEQRTIEVIRQVIYGMGLVPKELMLRQRIKTLESYVNAPAQTMTRELKNTLSTASTTAAENERGIQAWMSAYLTLGDYAYGDIDSIELQELLPDRGSQSNLLELKDVKVNFDAYATQFSLQSCPPDPNEWRTVPNMTSKDDEKPCVYCPTAFKMSGITVGVSKDPAIMTYYAVSLKARARILFSPFGDMTLKAYAAARPFGSRIGPELAASDLTKQAAYDQFCNLDPDGACFRQVPNLPLSVGETANSGWYRKDALFGFYWALNPNPSSGGFIANAITPDMVQSALHAASTPNPWEKGKYNIPHDLLDQSADQFERFFSPQDGNYAIWAPIVKNPGDEAELQTLVDEMVNNYTSASPNLQTSPTEFEAFKAAVKTDFRSYLAKLRNAQGEGGESMNIYRIKNPFRTLSSGGQATGGFIQLPAALAINGGVAPDQVRSAWDDVKDASFKSQGRTGYSVKFVSLKSLRDGGTSTNGSDTFSNYLAPLGDSASDLQFLQH